MRDQSIVLRHLVESLDEVRRFCSDASLHATRPWVKNALEQVAETHWHIAVELCTRITTTGPDLARDGRRRRTWRTTWSGWVVRNSFDSDLACVRQAKRHLERLTRQFAHTARRLPECATRWRLTRHVYEIDHARTKITRAVARVCMEIDARRIARYAGTRASASVHAVRPTVPERGPLGG